MTLPDDENSPRAQWLPVVAAGAALIARRAAVLREPDARAHGQDAGSSSIVRITGDDGAERDFVECGRIAECFPGMFGVRIGDDAMSPLLESGDIALVSPAAEPHVGRPALVRMRDDNDAACGVWLQETDGCIVLGRPGAADEIEVDAASVAWSLEILYGLRPAA